MKRRKKEPFFIVFANLDFVPKESTDKWGNIRWREHIKTSIAKDELHYKNHKKSIDEFLIELPKLNPPEIIQALIKICELIGQLIVYPDPEDRIDSFTRYINRILEKTSPALNWDNKRSKFSLGLIPQKYNLLYGLYFELSKFLEDHYREGIFARCGLEECDKFITTLNGRKYCCSSHSRKKYDLRKKKDREKDLGALLDYRIRDSLRQKYKRVKNSKGPIFIEKHPTSKTYIEKHYSKTLEEYLRKLDSDPDYKARIQSILSAAK
ncbi:hypothetical protein ACFL7E_02560 [Thermodesulfobacteriota bacterium]